MVQRLANGWTVEAVAAAHGVTARTVRKWRHRFALEREAGLSDRSSRPHRSPTRLGEPAESEVLCLRRQRLTGPVVARRLGRPVSTVGVVLRRHGLGRLRALDPRPPVIRHQRDRPGEVVHIDIKRLGRIDGVGHRITGDRTGQSNSAAQAGSICTSRSMTRAGLPTPSCWRASARKARSLSPLAPSLARRPDAVLPIVCMLLDSGVHRVGCRSGSSCQRSARSAGADSSTSASARRGRLRAITSKVWISISASGSAYEAWK